MSRSTLSLSASLCLVLAAACTDSVAPPTRPTGVVAPGDRAALLNPFRHTKLVAIGTSISMGWQSDGVYGATQAVSWPALLELGTLRLMSLPLIASPGCQSPLVAPLVAGRRLSGESAAASTVCAPNEPGVTLPTQNVAISGALALDAVSTTPELGSVARPWYSRVLPPGATQLTAALAQHPTFVSVELGADEVLSAIFGLVAPGVTVVPFQGFAVPYDNLLNALGATGVQALLVGLPADARNLPALRRGDEIWADRFEFAALKVAVNPDCNGSQNYINVAVKSLATVFAAAASSQPVPFSCADIPGTADNVLTPADIATVNGLIAQMTAHIQQQASARGYAFVSLGALYDRSDAKGGSYSVIRHLVSPFPFGTYFSLDGVHPNAIGNGVLAAAAASAINTRYGRAAAYARQVGGSSLLNASDGMPIDPAAALAMARRAAAENAGVRVGQFGLSSAQISAATAISAQPR